MPLKPAKIYGALAAAKAGVPPTSSQVAFYEDVAEMVLLILKDADVDATAGAPPMTTAMGPVAGFGKIK